MELQIYDAPWQNGQRLYVVYDVTNFDSAPTPNSIHLTILSCGSHVAYGRGNDVISHNNEYLFNAWRLRPLTFLANQVSSTRPEKLPRSYVAESFPDEVGTLAQTLAQLLARIDEYIDNENAFQEKLATS